MKKILIVDDEKPISDIIKFNMTKEGYEVNNLKLSNQILLSWI